MTHPLTYTGIEIEVLHREIVKLQRVLTGIRRVVSSCGKGPYSYNLHGALSTVDDIALQALKESPSLKDSPE